MNMDEVFDVLTSSGCEFNESWTVDQLTDFIVESGIDITAFSPEQIEQLLDLCTDAHPEIVEEDGESAASETPGAQVSFTGADRCWWCSGSGVVWSGTENESCSHCGGSGIGPD